MDALLTFLLVNAMLAAALAGLLLALPWLMRRPAVAHRAWLVVLLKLVTPPLLVLPVAWPLETAAIPVPEVEPAPPAFVAQAADDGRPISAGPDLFEPISLAALSLEEPAPAALAPPGRTLHGAEMTAETARTPLRVQDALFFTWLIGALAWWGLAGRRLWAFHRLLRVASSPAPGSVREQAAAVTRRFGLRRVPHVEFIDAEVPPMLWSLAGRPRILLPRLLWARLDEGQRAAVLAHELAHLRRGDHWVRRLELVALGLYWWCPLVWWLRGKIEEAEESCCDAWVLWAIPGSAPAYAEALVETVAYLSRPAPLLASGAGRTKGLKRRLVMILQRPPAPRLSWAAATCLLALAVLALPWRPGLAEAEEPAVNPTAPATPAPPVPPASPPSAPLPAAEASPPPLPPARPYPPAPMGTRPAPAGIPPGYPPASGGLAMTPPGNYPTTAARWTTPADLEALRDEVELLEAQREVKKAHVQAAAVATEGATQSLKRRERAFEQKQLSLEELDQARTAAESARAQLVVREAEMREHDVKLSQAKRRLTAASAKPKAPSGMPPGAMPPAPGGRTPPAGYNVPSTPNPPNRSTPAAEAPARGGPKGETVSPPSVDPASVDRLAQIEQLMLRVRDLQAQIDALQKERDRAGKKRADKPKPSGGDLRRN